MGWAFALTLPGLVIGLVGLGVAGLVRRAWRQHRGRPALPRASAGAGFDVLGVLIDPGRRHVLEERASRDLRRDDEEDGAPPRSRVDLERGKAWIRSEEVVPPDGLTSGD